MPCIAFGSLMVYTGVIHVSISTDEESVYRRDCLGAKTEKVECSGQDCGGSPAEILKSRIVVQGW